MPLLRLLALWAVCLGLSPAQAAALPHPLPVPGGILQITLGPVQTGLPPPRLWLGNQPLLVVVREGQWQALVGIALDTPPGRIMLRQGTDLAHSEIRFEDIQPKEYPSQYITLKNKGQVALSPENEARVARELEEIRRLKTSWRAAPEVDTRFALPAEGRLSGRFGVRRFFNGQPRAPHVGLDVAAGRGAPVRAVAAGQVLAVADYFFNGRSVFVDHGQGLISLYCHLERIDVTPGQQLEKGTQLGAVGSSGRATGPHLHWSVILNGVMVDPELFLE